MNGPFFSIHPPDWLATFMTAHKKPLPAIADRMALTIELSEKNVTHQTGGPFATVIFDTQTWIPLSAGVNLVETAACSILHGEIVAICTAHRKVGHFDLGGLGLPPYELVTSTEPCAMCIGAICWSGIKYLVYGARDEDARQIGFDEGPKEKNWQRSLENRDITVTRDVSRSMARRVLQKYADKGGLIYNARQG